MSSGGAPDNSSIGVAIGTSHQGLILPWSWPEGARVLLAALAIMSAIGLMAGRRHRLSHETSSELAGTDLKLDPNTATPEALASLPHIGPTLARRIADARAQGPFRSPDDLRARVRGIGPSTLAQIEPYLRIDAWPLEAPRLVVPETVIADARPNTGDSPPPSSRKPPQSRTRKGKGSSVQLVAKGGTSESP
jgi:competence protein ComEA